MEKEEPLNIQWQVVMLNLLSVLHSGLDSNSEYVKKINDSIGGFDFIYFCSFGPEWEDSSKHLLAIYLNNEIEIAKSVFNEWFKTGKNDRIKFREKYKMDIGDPYVLEEYNKHLEWGRINNIESTPTVFVNGYLLPDLYKLEDIRYFVDIDL